MPREMNLTPEEEVHIADAPKCQRCGHSWALHNTHCCAFCLVPSCACEDMWEPDASQDTMEPFDGTR